MPAAASAAGALIIAKPPFPGRRDAPAVAGPGTLRPPTPHGAGAAAPPATPRRGGGAVAVPVPPRRPHPEGGGVGDEGELEAEV